MSYTTEKGSLGKESLIAVGLVFDKCSLVAGISPCTATQSGDLKCHNTRATCNDPTNYTRTTEEIKFCEPRSNLPVGEKLYPMLDGKVEKVPTSITGGKGLGNRSIVTVRIKDFTHNDRDRDPYWRERSVNYEESGTFWVREFARNPYYEGRTLKLYYGYLTSPFSWDNFQTHEYDIDDAQGPDKGIVTFTAKDILVRTYGERQKYPALSNGELSAGIAASAGSATLSPAGIGNSEYPASGYVSIGKDIKGFTRSGDALTFTSHGAWGSEDNSHNAGDLVQLCVSWSGTNAVDVLDELLTTGAGIPAAMIPYDNGATGTPENWDIEKDLWMSTALVTGILSKPEDIDKIIKELSEQFLFDIWYDATSQEIKIKALSPEPGNVAVPSLTDGYEILKETLKIKRDSRQRLSQVQVWYGKLNHAEGNDRENFGLAKISADTSRPGPNKYGREGIKVIYSRWIADGAQASTLANRLLARFADTPEVIEFEIAPKDEDSCVMAERIELNTWKIGTALGVNKPTKYQVTEVYEVEPGQRIRVRALTSKFAGRYFFIAPDGTPDYSSATEEQKQSYGFICYDTGVFLDGESAYKVI